MRSRDPALCRLAAAGLHALLRSTAPSRIADACRLLSPAEEPPAPSGLLRSHCRGSTPAVGRPFGFRAPPVPAV